MPRTKFHKSAQPGDEPQKDTSVNDLLEDCPKITGECDYPTHKLNRAMAQVHLDEKLEAKLEQLQLRLKEDKIKVNLKRIGDTVVMVATLPLKPGDTHPQGRSHKQYNLTVNGKGFPFNLDGLAEADMAARQLGKRMATRTFDWKEEYLGKQVPPVIEKPKSIGELLAEFEKQYFLTRKRNRQSESTFTHKLLGVLKRSLSDLEKPLSDKVLEETINSTPAGTSTRFGLVSALSVFCKTFKYQFDFKGYKNGYKPKERQIPTDDEIVESFYLFTPNKRGTHSQYQAYQWIYGMLATYGLRPHEVFAVDLDKFLATANKEKVLYLDESLTDGIKTGSRVVFPLHPEWVDLFDLKNPKPLKSVGNLKSKGSRITDVFNSTKIPFNPYDLRHAYAIRGHVLGMPLKAMADNMGHSVEMHTRTYQKYMSLDTRKEVYNQVIGKAQVQQAEKSELELLREKLAQTEAKNQQLETENQQLKTQLGKSASKIEQLEAELEVERQFTDKNRVAKIKSQMEDVFNDDK